MSPDTATQVREYLQSLDSDAAPITIEELEQAPGSLDAEGLLGDEVLAEYVSGPDSVPVPQVIPSLTPRRRWITIGAAVAAAVLLIVGLVVLIDRDGEGVVTDSDPVSVPDTVDPTQLEWSRVPHDEATFAGPGGLFIESVAAGGPGLVAVGSANGSGEEDPSTAAVWTSADGVSWSRVPHDEAAFGGSRTEEDALGGPRHIGMNSVAAGGPGLVAVGSADPHAGEDGMVWTSVDGVVWSRVPDEAEVFGGLGEQWIGDVTAGGPGLVAVGWDLSGTADAAAWTSVDGVSWSRVSEEGLPGAYYHDGMADVTAGGPGLVAVGSAWDAGQTAAIWTSVDGLTWSKVPYDEAVFGGGPGWIYGVTVGGPGLVAVGTADGPDSQGGGDAAVWTSVDGLTWSRVPHNEAIFGGPGHQEMRDVTAAGSGLVAVGVDESDDEEVAAVWTSTDGITWSRVPDDEAIFAGGMSSVVSTESGVVAVGGDGPNAAVWVGTPTD